MLVNLAHFTGWRVQRRRGLRHNMLAFIGIVIPVYAVVVVIGV